MKNQTVQICGFLILCILTIVGIVYAANRARPDFYYLTGTVISAKDESFCITILPDESKADTGDLPSVCCFDLADFHSEYPLPAIGEKVRLTCTQNMQIWIGIYRAEDLRESIRCSDCAADSSPNKTPS